MDIYQHPPISHLQKIAEISVSAAPALTDRRANWITGGDGLAFLPAPTGLLAMVEDMGDRSTFLSPFDRAKTNGLRPVSAQGSFDYYTTGVLSPWGNHVWGPIENFNGPNGSSRINGAISKVNRKPK